MEGGLASQDQLSNDMILDAKSMKGIESPRRAKEEERKKE